MTADRFLGDLRDRRVAGAVVAAAVALAGAVVGILLPRGPVTAAEALALMALGLALGLGAGRLLRSRLALLAPLAYMAGFEAAARGGTGPTVVGIHLGSTWGILALIAGRGFHGLVALLPLLLGAALGAALARRGLTPAPRGRTSRAWLYARRAVTAAVAAGLATLAVLIALPASTPPVRAADGSIVPGSVAELRQVMLGGVAQWVEIRARSADDPVLLYLPGGPGQSDLGLGRALLRDLEQHFVVVIWDGRGIGKSYASFDAGLTTDRVVADTVELTNYLRRRFDEGKIYLFGESGGSVIGVLAVQRHPELYHAWLGSGQMVDPRETDLRIYRDLLAWGRAHGDSGIVRRLEGYGEPPYDSAFAYADVMGYYDELAGEYDPPAYYTRLGESSGVGFLGLMAPEYGVVDKVNAVRGLMDVFSVLYPQWQGIDFRRTAEHLAVPVYVFTGDHELAARRDLAVEWFRDLDAPVKRLYSFANAGHATAFEHVQAFERILERVVVPETYG